MVRVALRILRFITRFLSALRADFSLGKDNLLSNSWVHKVNSKGLIRYFGEGVDASVELRVTLTTPRTPSNLENRRLNCAMQSCTG